MSLLATVLELTAALPTIDIPDPEPVAPPGFEGPAVAVLSAMKWGGLILGVIGLMVIAIGFLINTRRGEASQEAKNLLWWVIGITLISGASAIVGWASGV
jgi:hypothetical protein